MNFNQHCIERRFMTEKKSLEELDLLRISRLDHDIDRLIISLELGKTHMKNLQDQLSKRNGERNELYSKLKEKYEVDDFTYNHDTGEIRINPSNKPASL